jgi:flagellar protein FlaG
LNVSAPILDAADTIAPDVLSAAVAPSSQAPTQSAGSGSPDLGLMIEDDKAAGEYVYKTIDRRTGDVVSQWPTEQVLRLREASNYSPGKLVQQVA